MPKREVTLEKLDDFIPEGSLDDVLQYLHRHKVHLTIKKERATLLGDYRFAHDGKSHRISVNGNLNKFSFLITLLHELAHLLTFEKYGNRAAPHGKEWKTEYGLILEQFIVKNIFPHDIRSALMRSLQNPSASSCGDDGLMRVLHRYDRKPENACLIEQLQENELFSIKGGRTFRRFERIRTRYKCREETTGKWYLFSGVYEVYRK